MPITLTSQEHEEVRQSLKRYFSRELDQEIGDLQARLLTDYILKEIAPLAYNQGVRDAESFFRRQLEDLSATCFEPPLTFWSQRPK